MNKVFARRVLKLTVGYGVLESVFCIRPTSNIISGVAIDKKGVSERIYRFALPLYDLIPFVHLDYATLLPLSKRPENDRQLGVSSVEFADIISREDPLTRARAEISGFQAYLEALIISLKSKGVSESALVTHRACLASTLVRRNDYLRARSELERVCEIIDNEQPGLRQAIESSQLVGTERQRCSRFSPADINQAAEALSLRRQLKTGIIEANAFLDYRESRNRDFIGTLWMDG